MKAIWIRSWLTYPWMLYQTKTRASVGVMVGQRRTRWPTNNPTTIQRLVPPPPPHFIHRYVKINPKIKYILTLSNGNKRMLRFITPIFRLLLGCNPPPPPAPQLVSSSTAASWQVVSDNALHDVVKNHLPPSTLCNYAITAHLQGHCTTMALQYIGSMLANGFYWMTAKMRRCPGNNAYAMCWRKSHFNTINGYWSGSFCW